jgi:hypothetical protein
MGISMSREDYVAIGVRLFAVYVGIKTVLALPASAQAVFRDGMAFAWLYALVLILAVGICVFLWFFPLTIARKLLPVMKEQRSEESIDASVGLSLGLTLLGVWFLAQGLLDSLYWLSLVLRTQHLQAQQYGFEWQPDQIASMAVTLFELIIGAWLVLGSSGIRRLIYRLRYGSS